MALTLTTYKNKGFVLSLFAFLILSGCKSVYILPPKAYQDSLKLATIDSIYSLPKYSAGPTSSNHIEKTRQIDSLKQVNAYQRGRLDQSRAKPSRRKAVKAIILGVVFVVAKEIIVILIQD